MLTGARGIGRCSDGRVCSPKKCGKVKAAWCAGMNRHDKVPHMNCQILGFEGRLAPIHSAEQCSSQASGPAVAAQDFASQKHLALVFMICTAVPLMLLPTANTWCGDDVTSSATVARVPLPRMTWEFKRVPSFFIPNSRRVSLSPEEPPFSGLAHLSSSLAAPNSRSCELRSHAEQSLPSPPEEPGTFGLTVCFSNEHLLKTCQAEVSSR